MNNNYQKTDQTIIQRFGRKLLNEDYFFSLINSTETRTREKILKTITEFDKVQQLNVTIFPKSFAFRVGTSSKNVISSYPMGFKGDLKDQTQFVTLLKKLESNKSSIILNDLDFKNLVLLYFLLYRSGKVKYGEDKTLKAETATITQTLSKMRTIMSDRDYLYIQIGKEQYMVDDFKKISGVPKADAAFYFRNNPVIFCSLKNGGQPGNFQQYGGWPVDLGIKNRDDVKKYPVVEKFVTKVENIFKSLGLKPDSNNSYDFNQLKKGSNFADFLDDPELAYRVIYGKDYGSTNWGINNVQILLDGDIIFKPLNGYYTLEGSFHTDINPKLTNNQKSFSIDQHDIYTPVMMLAKSESQGLNQGGFKNVRAYVFPNNKVAKSYMAKTNKIQDIISRGDKTEIQNLKNELVK
jgi:hypothetical protein